jgi:putative membrane protein
MGFVRSSLAAAVVALASSWSGGAHTNKPTNPDQAFADKAVTGGMAEVQLGELAQTQAQGDEVRRFGQRMVADHTLGVAQLMAMAKRKGLTLPKDLTSEQQATYDRLAQLSGAQFDEAYMKDMQEDHDEDVVEFKREAENGLDPDLKAWAGKTLPTLQLHDYLVHRYHSRW